MAAYYTSEVQGRGRRFWFKLQRDARAFEAAKKAAGYHVTRWERTVWVPFSKKRSEHSILVAAGYDVWGL
jgi:hypothetical protein